MRKLRANPERFIKDLAKIDWKIDKDMDVDDMVDNWNSGVKKALDALAEKKTRNLAKRKKFNFLLKLMKSYRS